MLELTKSVEAARTDNDTLWLPINFVVYIMNTIYVHTIKTWYNYFLSKFWKNFGQNFEKNLGITELSCIIDKQLLNSSFSYKHYWSIVLHALSCDTPWFDQQPRWWEKCSAKWCTFHITICHCWHAVHILLPQIPVKMNHGYGSWSIRCVFHPTHELPKPGLMVKIWQMQNIPILLQEYLS